MYNKLPTIYIGYDPKESIYYHILKKSIENNTKRSYNIVPIVQKEVRRAGLYWRSHEIVDGRTVDCFDGKPFSTEFSFTRFLVPFLNQFSGLALFMDCDMYVRSSIDEIFDRYASYAISCVQHSYKPSDKLKMDGQIQTSYRRKNWSSFVLWNCDHPENKNLTISDVNTKPGSFLHGFDWMDYSTIGSINEEWNWLDGHSSENIEPKCVHFTTGGPAYDNWVEKREVDKIYSDEWRKLLP